MESEPKGVFEGRIALIWPGLKKIGMAATLVTPCDTLMDTPPSVVDSGKARAGLVPGPSPAPKMENTEPCAMLPFGRPE